MVFDEKTNTGYKHNVIVRHSDTVVILSLTGIITLLAFNWTLDGTDRANFCDSILPVDNYTQYKDNSLENKYCYTHLEEYNYTDRYFDIPPRDYK